MGGVVRKDLVEHQVAGLKTLGVHRHQEAAGPEPLRLRQQARRVGDARDDHVSVLDQSPHIGAELKARICVAGKFPDKCFGLILVAEQFYPQGAVPAICQKASHRGLCRAAQAEQGYGREVLTANVLTAVAHTAPVLARVIHAASRRWVSLPPPPGIGIE